MAGKKDSGCPETSTCSLQEQIARMILRNVRSRGHVYVELRKDGKRFIFFCTLCWARCFGETPLYDHLKGKFHKRRLEGAKATLLKPNPWPFKDGVLFFGSTSTEENKKVVSSSSADQTTRLLDGLVDGSSNDLAIVCHEGNLGTNEDDDTDNVVDYDFVVPKVLLGDLLSDIRVRLMGVGKIAARFFLKDEVTDRICRIWCEWLGNDQNTDTKEIPEHELGVLTCAYNSILGRKGLIDDVKYLLSSSSRGETTNSEDDRKKKRRCNKDPGDFSASSTDHCGSAGEASLKSANSRMLLECKDDDQLLLSRFMSSKSRRKQLRRQQSVAAEKVCAICQHKLLLGKDVATLLDTKTGKLVCGSRNQNGAFHVFHISCLIHWILLCESEINTQLPGGVKVEQKSRRKTGSKCMPAEVEVVKTQIDCLFCPECQGSGVIPEGDELERPSMDLNEIFHYKLKLFDAHKAWMKSPEELQNCSTGFHFPSQSEEPAQELVTPLKLLKYYRFDG